MNVKSIWLLFFTDPKSREVVLNACKAVGSISNTSFDIRFNPDIFSPGMMNIKLWFFLSFWQYIQSWSRDLIHLLQECVSQRTAMKTSRNRSSFSKTLPLSWCPARSLLSSVSALLMLSFYWSSGSAHNLCVSKK